jgi:hypothetical protein
MDFLPIQASSVPCERAFSSSAETDTKKRNRMGSALMEVLQMTKFELKKGRHFNDLWVTPDSMMNAIDPEEDLLARLMMSDNADAIDAIIRDGEETPFEPIHL